MAEDLQELCLLIPGGSTCGAWLLAQSPPVRAEALALCEPAWTGLRRGLAEGVLEDRHATEISALEQKLRGREEELRQHRAAHVEEVQVLRATQEGRAEQLGQRLRDVEAMLTQTRTDHAAQLRQALQSGRVELECIHAAALEATRTAQQAMMEDLQTRARLEAQAHETELGRLRAEAAQRAEADLAALRDEVLWLRGQMTEHTTARAQEQRHYVQRLEDLTAEHARHAAATTDRVEALATEHRGLLGRLSGATATGRVGENLVFEVFARLGLGTLTDDHAVATEGHADGLWHLEDGVGPVPLRALVEVKNVQGRLHSQRDLGKFQANVRDAAAAGVVNAGLLLSLCARTSPRTLDIVVLHGLPVLMASRAPDDPISATDLVELAFTTFARAWPLLCRAGGDGADQGDLARELAETIDAQLQEISTLTRRAETIRRAAQSLLREAHGIDALRERLVRALDTARARHPSLALRGPVAPPWETPGALALLEDVRKHWETHRRRYPSSAETCELSDVAQAYLASDPGALAAAVARLRRENVREAARKRSAEAPLEGDE